MFFEIIGLFLVGVFIGTTVAFCDYTSRERRVDIDSFPPIRNTPTTPTTTLIQV